MNKMKYLIMLLCCIVFFNATAAVKVTKVILTSNKRSTKATSNEMYVVSCEGKNAQITSDGNGGSYFWVDEDCNGSFDDNERNTLAQLREAFDVEDLEWEDISVVISGKNSVVGNTATLYMTGGVIGTIYAGSIDLLENGVQGTVNVYLLGGEVGDFQACCPSKRYSDMKSTTVNLVMSGITYYGYVAPRMIKDYADEDGEVPIYVDNLVIANDCHFNHTEAQLTKDIFEKITNGALVQTLSYSYTIYNNNAATPFVIPSCVDITTEYLHDVYATNPVQNNGKITVTGCGGYTKKGTWTGNVVEGAEHDFQFRVIKPATCTTAGMKAKECTKCFISEFETVRVQNPLTGRFENKIQPVQQSIPALGHFEDFVIARAATCVADGWTQGSTCKRCGTVFKASTVVQATGHNWRAMRNFKCNGQSDTDYMCSKCNSIKVDHPEIHNWGEETKTGATCHTYGYTEKVCNDCDYARMYLLMDSYEPHKYVTHAKPATCTEPGHETYYTCEYDGCNQVFTELGQTQGVFLYEPVVIPASGHVWVKYNRESALVHEKNCEEPKTFYYSCRNCTENKYDSIYTTGSSFGGHVYRIKSIDYVNPNYPESGKLTLTCDRCNEEWANFSFAHSRVRSGNSSVAYNCVLTSVDTRPTCQPGLGTYTLDLNYSGQDLKKTYEGPILPVYAVDENDEIIEGKYAIHDWDDHGHCAHHPEEQDVAGYIRYIAHETLANNYEYKYDDGASFDNVDDMLRSDIGDRGNADSYEAKAFNYTLEDGKEFSNIINNVVSVNTFDYNRAVVGGRIVTFSLPADVPTSCVNGTVYKLTNFDQENQRLVFEEYTESDIEPYTPYLVQLNNDATTLISGPVGPVTLGPTTDAPYAVYVMDSQSGWQVCRHLSTYSTYIIPEGSQWYSYYGYDATDGAFVKANSGTVRPFRTVFEISNDFLNMTNNAAPRLGLMLNDTDGATSIIAVDADKLGAEGSEIYDLTGKKAAMPLHGHIYIINGKKQLK